MDALLLKLMNLSLGAGWLILAVVLLRLLFRRMPKWCFCLLWGLVALRLLCPFTIESSLSVQPSADPLPQDLFYAAAPVIDSGIPPVDDVINPILEDSLAPHPGASANPSQIWGFLLSCQWVLGAGVMVLYALFSWIRLRLKLRTATLLNDNIFESEFAPTPFVLGVFRPKIYIPYNLAPDDLPHVIAHEQNHIRRKDHWWKPLAFFLLAVYWFHPLIWLAYILFCRDMEAACDESVIKNLSPEGTKAYSAALLHCSISKRRLAMCPLAFGEVGIKARIKGILRYKKPALWVSIGAVVVCLAVGILFLTKPPEKPETPVDLSRTYTLEEVKAGEFVVFEDGNFASGQKYWEDFLKKCQSGKKATVYLANYYTLDQERVAPEYYKANKDRYPLLFVKELTFDGSYHLRWFDYGKEYTESYKYLRKLVDTTQYGDYTSVVRYVITDHPTATWEDLWKSTASSVYGVQIPYRTVYTKYRSDIPIPDIPPYFATLTPYDVEQLQEMQISTKGTDYVCQGQAYLKIDTIEDFNAAPVCASGWRLNLALLQPVAQTSQYAVYSTTEQAEGAPFLLLLDKKTSAMVWLANSNASWYPIDPKAIDYYDVHLDGNPLNDTTMARSFLEYHTDRNYDHHPQLLLDGLEVYHELRYYPKECPALYYELNYQLLDGQAHLWNIYNQPNREQYPSYPSTLTEWVSFLNP